MGEKWTEHPMLTEYHFEKGIQRVRRETDVFLASLGYERVPGAGAYRVVRSNDERVALFAHQGFGLAFFVGWFLELKFINFKTNVAPKIRLRRILIGFAILGVIAVVVQPLLKIFVGVAAYEFWKAFLPFFAILFVVPLIFMQVERRLK